MRRRTMSLSALAVLLAVAPAQAQERAARRLAWDPRIDGAVTATAGVWMIASELLKADLVPEKCRWCYRTPEGADALNPVDGALRRGLMWRNTRAADLTSSVIGFAVMPASAIGMTAGVAAHDGALDGAGVDVLLTAEATMLAVDLNQIVKLTFARERPFVHYLPRAPDGVRALTASPSDDNLSFYSGHTNVAFALAASSGTIALMRGYRLAPLVLGIGLVQAAAVGYLRIAADKHYFSDVMVGAVVGSVVGAFVPLVFHRATEARAVAAPQQANQALGVGQPGTPITIEGTW